MSGHVWPLLRIARSPGDISLAGLSIDSHLPALSLDTLSKSSCSAEEIASETEISNLLKEGENHMIGKVHWPGVWWHETDIKRSPEVGLRSDV